MDLDTIKEAIACCDENSLFYEFIDDKAVIQKFVDGDPREFYEILSVAINLGRERFGKNEGGQMDDDLILPLIRAAKEVHFGLFDGRTLLTEALQNRSSYKIIDELIKAGSDVNAATLYGTEPPLICAIEAGNEIEIVAELINRGADINCRNRLGWTPFFCGMGQRSKCPYLLLCGMSYHYDRPDLILMLLNAGSNVHDLDYNGRNVLMIESCFCVEGDNCQAKESIDMLIEHGINNADLKHTDKNGNTVLHETRCKYVFELALKAGVSIEAKNNKGQTPLLSSLEQRRKKKLVFLLRSGAIIRTTDPESRTALHQFICTCFDTLEYDVLYMLIYHGGDVYECNSDNEKLLDVIIDSYCFADCSYSIEEFLDFAPTYVIAKHIILFQDNGFDIATKDMEKLSDVAHINSFLRDCVKELDVMRKTFIKDGLTFYEFCILKRYYKSKCVNIKPNEYKYSFSEISKLFPRYRNVIIIRIKDNRNKKREIDFRRVFERIVLRPDNTTGMNYNEILNYDCLYHVSQYLNFKDMFNVFTAAIEC